MTVTEAATAAVSAGAGELLAVIGPDGSRRTACVLALADAFGGVCALSVPDSAEAWRDLRRLAAGGVTVVTACGCVADAGRYAHRTVVLPAD
jgi:hypothetical protein